MPKAASWTSHKECEGRADNFRIGFGVRADRALGVHRRNTSGAAPGTVVSKLAVLRFVWPTRACRPVGMHRRTSRGLGSDALEPWTSRPAHRGVTRVSNIEEPFAGTALLRCASPCAQRRATRGSQRHVACGHTTRPTNGEHQTRRHLLGDDIKVDPRHPVIDATDGTRIQR